MRSRAAAGLAPSAARGHRGAHRRQRALPHVGHAHGARDDRAHAAARGAGGRRGHAQGRVHPRPRPQLHPRASQ
eukprot:5905289-Prymnesium_polylepis.1